FFGTLYNTYSFFALYANVDNFSFKEEEIPINERPEIDRWIMSILNSLVKKVESYYNNYEPTKAGRAIQYFVTENLSNWYVRLNRKRFWGGEYSKDKIAAYQTLYTCLETISIISSPIAPFFMDQLYQDLNKVTQKHETGSVHLSVFPKHKPDYIDIELENRMDLAQKISSMILGLRRKVSIRVRQPLSKIMIPVHDETTKKYIEAVKNIILSETNVKDIEYLSDTTDILVKKIKPNFKILGPKYGKLMKQISASLSKINQKDIAEFENNGKFVVFVNEESIELHLEDVEIISEDIPGWLVANEGKLTVALDVNITEELKQEGIAREFINRIQNLRKDRGFDVTDKITLNIQKHELINKAINSHKQYIGSQTLATTINLVDKLENNNAKDVEIDEEIKTRISISKI
ncbi:MAG: isoleucine--tRNA ligase, partial [Bacteroidetes bacterium]